MSSCIQNKTKDSFLPCEASALFQQVNTWSEYEVRVAVKVRLGHTWPHGRICFGDPPGSIMSPYFHLTLCSNLVALEADAYKEQQNFSPCSSIASFYFPLDHAFRNCRGSLLLYSHLQCSYRWHHWTSKICPWRTLKIPPHVHHHR